jgi:streptomycin 6-kinase
MWELTNPQPLTQTHTSELYLVRYQGEMAVLKLLNDEGGVEERVGAIALRHFDGYGAVRLLRDDENAHLLEYIPGDDLMTMVKRGGDAQATAIIADVLNTLHRVQKAPPEGLFTLERWFRSLFQRVEHDPDSIFARGAVVARELLDNQRDIRVLHGDIHHENIRYSPERGWLAFDPKGLIGERTYDVANTFCNPGPMRELVEDEARVMQTAKILSEKLHIELSRILRFTFAYACLSASWWLDDDKEVEAGGALRIAEIVEPHIRKD